MNKNLLTTREIKLREELMSRVRAVNSTRTFIVSPLAGILLVGMLFFATSLVVSIGDVVRNIMMHGEWSLRFSYTYSALIHSRVIVQILASLTTLALGLVFLRSVRYLRSPFSLLGNILTTYSPLRFFRS